MATKSKPDNARLRRFYALLKQAGVAANKTDILAGFGVESTNDLTVKQLDELLETLQRLADSRHQASPEVRKARSRVLTICTDLGVFVKNDWKKLNAFIIQPRIAGKLLYDCSLEELQVLNRKLSKMLRDRVANIEQEDTMATNN